MNHFETRPDKFAEPKLHQNCTEYCIHKFEKHRILPNMHRILPKLHRYHSYKFEMDQVCARNRKNSVHFDQTWYRFEFLSFPTFSAGFFNPAPTLRWDQGLLTLVWMNQGMWCSLVAKQSKFQRQSFFFPPGTHCLFLPICAALSCPNTVECNKELSVPISIARCQLLSISLPQLNYQ